jgi:hypothetical protein
VEALDKKEKSPRARRTADESLREQQAAIEEIDSLSEEEDEKFEVFFFLVTNIVTWTGICI